MSGKGKKSLTKKVIGHLKSDIKDFKEEAKEDKKLIKEIKKKNTSGKTQVSRKKM